MRRFIIISIIFSFCILTAGYINYGKPVRVTFAIDNGIYEVTNVVVTQNELGVSIGSVNREVSPRPKKNGDIARNTSEGPSVIGDNGGKLYEIKDTKSRKQIAIEMSKGTYYRSNYIGELK